MHLICIIFFLYVSSSLISQFIYFFSFVVVIMPAQTFYTAVNVADCRDNRHFIHYTNKNEIQYDKNFMTTWQKERNTSYALNKLKIRPSSGWKDASL